MTTVQQLLLEKGKEVWSVRPEQTVLEAIRMMDEKNVGALLVMAGDRLVGIVTERHYARNVILKGRASPSTPVREIMESQVLWVGPTQTVEECMALMTAKFVRHLPVIESGRVIGVLSIGDLVKSIISEQRFVIEQLEHYITS
ncbi:MAG: CBS domain-containing protein [Pseudomonadota bacterium]